MSISRMIIYSSSLVAILAGVAGYIAYDSFSQLEQTIIEAKDWKNLNRLLFYIFNCLNLWSIYCQVS